MASNKSALASDSYQIIECFVARYQLICFIRHSMMHFMNPEHVEIDCHQRSRHTSEVTAATGSANHMANAQTMG
jgi:hypothetical protein